MQVLWLGNLTLVVVVAWFGEVVSRFVQVVI